jgi:hypothetical protein
MVRAASTHLFLLRAGRRTQTKANARQGWGKKPECAGTRRDDELAQNVPSKTPTEENQSTRGELQAQRDHKHKSRQLAVTQRGKKAPNESEKVLIQSRTGPIQSSRKENNIRDDGQHVEVVH